MTYYDNSAHGYLARAKRQLQSAAPDGIFYAAYELRCAVEARQDQYLDAQKQYEMSIKRAQAWKIADQGRALEKIFASDRIQQLTWVIDDVTAFDVYHVPVSGRLRSQVGRLNGLRHAQTEWRDEDDEWWEQTHSQLVEVYRGIWAACQGHLLSPALLVGGNAIGSLVMEFERDERDAMQNALAVGRQGLLRVDYHDQPPDQWVCDF